jgi:hypothetical protein
MNADNCRRGIFCLGVAVTAFGTVVYGLFTGDIVTLGGSGRDPDMVWQSRAGEPQLFWIAVGIHVAVGSFFGYMALREARGKE